MNNTLVINGKNVPFYELSNGQLINLMESNTLMGSEKAILCEEIVRRFKAALCPEAGENYDDVFARLFSSFVNGKLCSKEHVAEKMCFEHRYLQDEMFRVCLAYITKLAENYEKGCYDGRNKYAVTTSSKIIEHFKATNYPY